jgi:hypothetical protein
VNRKPVPLMTATVMILLTWLSACENQPVNVNNSMTVGFYVRDWTVGVTATSLAAVGWTGDVDPAFALAADEFFPDRLRLYSIDTGLPVAGEVRTGFFSLDGTELSEPIRVPGQQEGYSFVPDAPLADGWYILASERGTYFWPGVSHEAGVGYARFQVGNAPVWYGSAFYPLESDGVVAHSIGTYVAGPLHDLATNPFSLRVDGETDPTCLEHRADSGGWYWECPYLTPESQVTITLDDTSVVVPLQGVREQTHPAVVAAELFLVPRLGVDLVRGTP